MTNGEIIRAELQKIADEAIDLYEASGKKVSGQWPKGIKIESLPNKGVLYSYAYLAGRGKTRKGNDGSPTLQQRLLTWIKQRGIKPREPKMTLKSLSYAMAHKIHREGTNPSRHRAVFEEVLTPQRIQKIIDKVSEFNVGVFVRDAQIEFQKLSKKPV